MGDLPFFGSTSIDFLIVFEHLQLALPLGRLPGIAQLLISFLPLRIRKVLLIRMLRTRHVGRLLD
jgi:hypothetical protein